MLQIALQEEGRGRSQKGLKGMGEGGEKNAPKASLFPEEPTTTSERGLGRGTQNTHDALNTF